MPLPCTGTGTAGLMSYMYGRAVGVSDRQN